MTLIYQSYRTHNVPDWIGRCMDSVKEWTRKNGFEYRFIDDELFEAAPGWYREKVENNVQLVSDLARLIFAKRFLQEGYERVIWMDADLLIFDPDNFFPESTAGVYFCRETWVDADLDGNMIHQKKFNNSISIFHKGNVFLDFYIDACLKLVDTRDKIPHVLVGTTFLTALRKIYPFHEITAVGIMSPALTHDILTGKTAFLEKFHEWHAAPVYAANLCGSMQNRTFYGVEINEGAMTAIVKKLLEQKMLVQPVL